jgi:hypothetical protein
MAQRIESLYRDRELRERIIKNGFAEVERYPIEDYRKTLDVLYRQL